MINWLERDDSIGRLARKVLLLLLMINCEKAFAFNGEFYTYEGFSQTVNAFKVLALIFHDHQFKVLIGVFAIIGLFSGGFISFARAVFSGGQSIRAAIGWFFVPLFGCIVYEGLVLPKGNIHVYDKVSNQYQNIGNIPDLIIVVASVFNSIEEGLKNIISKNTASPYAKEVSGISFRLFYNTMIEASNTTDHYFNLSFKRFYCDCMPISNVADNKFSLERLLKNTQDIGTELQHLWHPSMFTIFFTEKNKCGDTLSCTDALKKIMSWANDPTNLQENFVKICKMQGFSKPEQLPICKTEIAKASSFIFNQQISADMLLRNAIFAKNIAQAIMEDNPDVSMSAFSNRKMLHGGLATATTAQTWMPTIKATMTAIVLGLMPFLILFFVTPFFTKSLILMFSLFAWLAIWGVCDVILHQSAIDQMIAIFESVRSYSIGLWALWSAPDAAIKALAIIGHSRTMSASIAGLVGSAIFGFSAYSFAGMSSGLTGKVEQSGGAAADRVLEPEQAANYLDSVANASAVTTTIGRQGWQAYSGAKNLQQASSVSQAQSMAEHFANDYNRAGEFTGKIPASKYIGEIDAYARSANDTGKNVQQLIRNTAETNTSTNIAHAAVTEQQVGDIGGYNPENNDSENREKLSQYHMSQTQAAIDASQGDINRYLETHTTKQEVDMATMEAQKNVAAQYGKDLPELKADVVTWDTMNTAEKLIAMQSAAKMFGMDMRNFTKSVNRGGIIQNLVLSSEQLKSINQQKPYLLPKGADKMFGENGAVITHAALTSNGRLTNITLANNQSMTQTQTTDTSLNLGNAASARQTLTDFGIVKTILDNKGDNALIQASTDAMQSIVDQRGNSATSGNIGVGVQAGGFSIKGHSSLDKNVSDQTTTNRMYGNFSTLISALRVQASHEGITDKEKQNSFVAKHYASAFKKTQDYYTQDAAKENLSVDSVVEGVKTTYDKVTKKDPSSGDPLLKYLKDSKLEKAVESFKTNSVGGKEKDD